MSVQKLVSLSISCIVLAACVTVNVYFPAEAAESAAREIVRDVIDEEAPAQDGNPQSAVLPADQPAALLAAVGHVLNWLVPPAHAQANIDISTPAIQRLRQSMKNRFLKLAPYYESGAIGFGANGLVRERDLSSVPLAQRNQLKKLIAEENQDRNALYEEIARANGHPEWEQSIRETFARVWIEEAPSGYYYQNSTGAWVQS